MTLRMHASGAAVLVALCALTLDITGCGDDGEREGQTPAPSPEVTTSTSPVTGKREVCLDLPAVIEAENDSSAGEVMTRDPASAGETLYLNRGGPLSLEENRISLPFSVCTTVEAQLSVTYSNDNSNEEPTEDVQVTLDGQEISRFTAEDTGGGGGFGWDVFVESPAVTVQLAEGDHVVEIAAEGGDNYGIEIDAVLMEAPS